jgi:hypothetical protein
VFENLFTIFFNPDMLPEIEQGSILEYNAESSTHYHNALNARKPLMVSSSPRSGELELYTLQPGSKYHK